MLTPIKCINFKRKRTTEVFFHCISFLIFSLISRLLSFNGKLKYFSLINCFPQKQTKGGYKHDDRD